MRTQRISALALAGAIIGSAHGQSDGGRFDALVVLVPGMAVQRGTILFEGGYRSGLLQHGDIVQTAANWSGPFLILTSDGSVIEMGGGSRIAIDARQIGFDVFQVINGSAAVVGNTNDGYMLPDAYRIWLPARYGNVIVHPSWRIPVTMPWTIQATVQPFHRSGTAVITNNPFVVTEPGAFVIQGIQFSPRMWQ